MRPPRPPRPESSGSIYEELHDALPVKSEGSAPPPNYVMMMPGNAPPSPPAEETYAAHAREEMDDFEVYDNYSAQPSIQIAPERRSMEQADTLTLLSMVRDGVLSQDEVVDWVQRWEAGEVEEVVPPQAKGT